MLGAIATQLVCDDAEILLEGWRVRCAADVQCAETFVGQTDFVVALGQTVMVPQVTEEGPVKEWVLATGDLVRRVEVNIANISRQFLHLEDEVVERLVTIADPIAASELTARVHRAIYSALEIAAVHLVESLAYRDELTSLLNRRAFDRDVSAAREKGIESLAVAVVDLDGLKQINDADGHEAGDLLIQRMGETLSGLTRPGINAYRWAGDEFSVLAEDEGEERLTSSLAEIRQQSGISFSFGVATWPDEDIEWSRVEGLADDRMYTEKRSRKARMSTWSQRVKRCFEILGSG